jgi:hypothetical protein
MKVNKSSRAGVSKTTNRSTWAKLVVVSLSKPCSISDFGYNQRFNQQAVVGETTAVILPGQNRPVEKNGDKTNDIEHFNITLR